MLNVTFVCYESNVSGEGIELGSRCLKFIITVQPTAAVGNMVRVLIIIAYFHVRIELRWGQYPWVGEVFTG
jgi:hypothetical protein